jgi:hypothetical protein
VKKTKKSATAKKAVTKKTPIETNVRDFKSIFTEFGEAVTSIFKDPKLKKEANKLKEGIVGSAKAFSDRFKDKSVKKEFRDVGKAATRFGKDAVKTYKKSKPKIEKAVKKATKSVTKTVKKIEKNVSKKKK